MLLVTPLFLHHKDTFKPVSIIILKTSKLLYFHLLTEAESKQKLFCLFGDKKAYGAHLAPTNEVLETLVPVLLTCSLKSICLFSSSSSSSSSGNYCNNSKSHKPSVFTTAILFHCRTHFALSLGQIQSLQISLTTGGGNPARVTIWRAICFGTASACDRILGEARRRTEGRRITSFSN